MEALQHLATPHLTWGVRMVASGPLSRDRTTRLHAWIAPPPLFGILHATQRPSCAWLGFSNVAYCGATRAARRPSDANSFATSCPISRFLRFAELQPLCCTLRGPLASSRQTSAVLGSGPGTHGLRATASINAERPAWAWPSANSASCSRNSSHWAWGSSSRNSDSVYRCSSLPGPPVR